MNGSKYAELLEEELPPSITKFKRVWNQPYILMEDNARFHKTAIPEEVKARFKWEILEWPPYSPDLNPIENVWAEVKKEVQHYNGTN